MLTSEWRNLRSAQYPSGNQTYSYPSLGGRGGSTPNVEFPDMLLSLARGLRGLMGLDVIEGEVPLPFPPCFGARPSSTRSYSICSGVECIVYCCILCSLSRNGSVSGFNAVVVVQRLLSRSAYIFSKLERETQSSRDPACVGRCSSTRRRYREADCPANQCWILKRNRPAQHLKMLQSKV